MSIQSDLASALKTVLLALSYRCKGLWSRVLAKLGRLESPSGITSTPPAALASPFLAYLQQSSTDN